jgi:phosphatidylserine/phosphatidylglycerophosphate/cardiolipin synthase-like enzyme
LAQSSFSESSMFESLHRLTTAGLRDFAGLCRQRPGSQAPSMHALQQLAGTELGDQIGQQVRTLIDCGWRAEQLADLAETIAQARHNSTGLEQAIDLVLSGPDAPGVMTRDTAAVMHALFAEATQEVLLVGYAVYNARQLFEPLADRLQSEPGLRIRCCLEIGRKHNDTSLASEIVRRFAHEFATRHWPWMPKPELYYDPRSLEPAGARRSSLHAKCIVVDRRASFVTSANFTDAAQSRNIECGIVVRDAPFSERVASYFDALIATRQLSRCAVEDTPATDE